MASNLFDFFGEQSALSGIQDWAQQQYGQSNPALASLAQADPRSFRELLPKLVEQQQQGQAIQQFYGGGGAQQGGAQAPQGQTQQQADQQAQNAGITWDDPGFADMGGGGALATLAQQQQPAQPQGPSPSSMARYGAIANLPGPLQSIAAQQLMFEGAPGGGGGGGAGSGQVSLDSLPPNIAGTVKSMLEGRQAPPSSMALKTPYWQQLMNIANQVDPNFDQTMWQQRAKTVQDVISPSGKSRQNINSIETAVNHLSQLQDANTALGGWGALNELVRNPIMSATNDPRLGQYNTIAKTAADEVARATAGPGGSTVGDRNERLKEFSPDQSPEVRQANIQSAIGLLMGRLEPVASSYNAAMGKSIRPIELLSPETQASYQKLTGELPADTTAQGTYSPLARPGQQNALGRLTAPAAPDAGLAAELKRRGLLH